jgi:mannose-6-phosphate isomerase-like protein (cupin superfamily)
MDPVLLGPGEGETVTDRPGRHVQIKADHELLTVVEFLYGAGEEGAEPHIHHEHTDCFYVLEGELAFELGAEREQVTLEAGGFVLVPPEVVHSFRNDSSGDTRFLNLHAPGKGFADYMRGRDRESFDQHDPPADGGRPVADAILRRAGEGDEMGIGPSRVLFKAEGGDGDGTLALMQTTLAPGFPGPVPHIHPGTIDSFYVLEGTLTVRLGSETVEAGPGSYAFVPPGNVHTFSNPGGDPVRELNLMAPGGFEQFLKELAAAARPGEPPDPAVMAEMASRYDFEPAPH